MSSKGERIVENILLNNGIVYKKEFKFKNLRGFKHPLRFDFAIFYNNRISYLIEIDGEQHFKYIPHFHKTKSDFRKEIIMDQKKNSFCLLNNIPLIRIPYWELDNLDLKKIFLNKNFRVKNKHHYSYFGRG